MLNASATRRLPAGAVDCHAHVIKLNQPLISDRHSEPAAEATVQDYLAQLDAHGVQFGLLTAPSFYGPNNAVILSAIAEARGRLRGTATVEPTIAESDLASLQEQGICGVRLNWVKRDALPDINSPAYRSLLSKAHNLGLHVELYLEGEHLPAILKAVNASGARLVVDHFGNPGGEAGENSEGFLALLDAIEAGNTWVKLSAPFRLRGSNPTKLAEKIIAYSDGARALWATDWPWVGHEQHIRYEQCIDSLYECVPDETTRNRILTTNAYEAFGFAP